MTFSTQNSVNLHPPSPPPPIGSECEQHVYVLFTVLSVESVNPISWHKISSLQLVNVVQIAFTPQVPKSQREQQ